MNRLEWATTRLEMLTKRNIIDFLIEASRRAAPTIGGRGAADPIGQLAKSGAPSFRPYLSSSFSTCITNRGHVIENE